MEASRIPIHLKGISLVPITLSGHNIIFRVPFLRRQHQLIQLRSAEVVKDDGTDINKTTKVLTAEEKEIVTVELKDIPTNKRGVVIGRGGSNLRIMKEKYNVNIDVPRLKNLPISVTGAKFQGNQL